ncbi:MAG: hypothetical protein ACOCV2_14970 [Persicimonas sp.]
MHLKGPVAAGMFLLVLLAAAHAHAGEPASSDLKPWAVTAGAGYGQIFGVSDVNSSSSQTFETPALSLELAHRFGTGHQVAARGDYVNAIRMPESYIDVLATQVSLTYGYVVGLGRFQFDANGGVSVGMKVVAQSDVIGYIPTLGLTGTIGARYKPREFLGVGVDLIGATSARTANAQVAVEFSF